MIRVKYVTVLIIMIGACLLFISRPTNAKLEWFNYTGISAEFKLKCRDGVLVLHDTCYTFVDVKVTFDQAKSDCISKEAHLLSITAPEERVHLNFAKLLTTDELWLGLVGVSGGQTLEWSDGVRSAMYSDQLNSNWTLGVDPTCPALQNKGETVTFSECSQLHAYVCKARFYNECYPGWMYDPQRKKCYRLYGGDPDNIDKSGNKVNSLPKLTATQASEFCRGFFGGHLAPTFAAAFFTDHHPYWRSMANFWRAWVGIYYSADSSTNFVMDDGTELTLDEPGFFTSTASPSLYKCSYYQSQNMTVTELIKIHPTDQCDDTLYYICQTPSIMHPEPDSKESADENNSSCISDENSRSRWYRLVKNTRLGDHVMHTVSCSSRIECAVRCSNYPGCESFNYNYSKSNSIECELNSARNLGLAMATESIDYAYLDCDMATSSEG